jgi:hypothetical protein
MTTVTILNDGKTNPFASTVRQAQCMMSFMMVVAGVLAGSAKLLQFSASPVGLPFPFVNPISLFR